MTRAENLVNGVLVAFGVLAIALMGTRMAWDGLERGWLYAKVDADKVFTLVVERKERREKWIGVELRAMGWIMENGDRTDVQVFNPLYGLLERGHKIEAYRVAPGRAEYVSRAKYEESWPIIDLGLIAFSWHLPVGVAMIVVAWRLVVALRRRPGADPLP
ncbi:MAG TPA: hypothetical protein VFK48_07465 [Usitatibacter sp.]|nr:hypothetical protein [Usitatibacter sp.]